VGRFELPRRHPRALLNQVRHTGTACHSRPGYPEHVLHLRPRRRFSHGNGPSRHFHRRELPRGLARWHVRFASTLRHPRLSTERRGRQRHPDRDRRLVCRRPVFRLGHERGSTLVAGARLLGFELPRRLGAGNQPRCIWQCGRARNRCHRAIAGSRDSEKQASVGRIRRPSRPRFSIRRSGKVLASAQAGSLLHPRGWSDGQDSPGSPASEHLLSRLGHGLGRRSFTRQLLRVGAGPIRYESHAAAEYAAAMVGYQEDYFFLPFLAVFLTAFFAFFTIRTSFGLCLAHAGRSDADRLRYGQLCVEGVTTDSSR